MEDRSNWTRISKHNKTYSGKTVEERLFLFDYAIKASELNETINQVKMGSLQHRAMLASDKAMLGDRFSELVKMPDWDEISYVFEGRDLMNGSQNLLNPKSIDLLAVTAWHLQALRNGFKPVITPVAVFGITLTSDNMIVYGERGGGVDPGMLDTSPAGVSNSTLYQSYLTEMREELGIVKTRNEAKLIGYSTDHQCTKGILAVWYNQVDQSFAEIKGMHESVLKGRSAVFETRQALINEGAINYDAWEFRQLIGLPNDPNYLDKLLVDEQYIEAEINLPIRNTGVMVIDIYNQSLKQGKLD